MIYANAIRHCCNAFCSPATCCGLLLLLFISCHKPKLEPLEETVVEAPLTRGIITDKKLNGYMYVGLGPYNNQGLAFNCVATFNDPAKEMERRMVFEYSTPNLAFGNLSMGPVFLGDLPLPNSNGNYYQFFGNLKSDSLVSADSLVWKVSGNQAFKPFQAEVGVFPEITTATTTNTISVKKDLTVSCRQLCKDYDSLFVIVGGFGGSILRKAGAADTSVNFSRYELEPIRQHSSAGMIKVLASKFYYLVKENKKYMFEVSRKHQVTITLTQ